MEKILDFIRAGLNGDSAISLTVIVGVLSLLVIVIMFFIFRIIDRKIQETRALQTNGRYSEKGITEEEFDILYELEVLEMNYVNEYYFKNFEKGIPQNFTFNKLNEEDDNTEVTSVDIEVFILTKKNLNLATSIKNFKVNGEELNVTKITDKIPHKAGEEGSAKFDLTENIHAKIHNGNNYRDGFRIKTMGLTGDVKNSDLPETGYLKLTISDLEKFETISFDIVCETSDYAHIDKVLVRYAITKTVVQNN